MSEKFTPGPWKAKSNNPDNKFSWLIYNKEYSKWPIAVEMKKEDAHLIAAAPEMYEAIAQALSYLKSSIDEWQEGEEMLYEILKRALAKAKAKVEGR